MKTDEQQHERISALMDGESADAEADRNWLASDAQAMSLYRRYQRIQALTKTLPEPEPSPDFVRRVMAQTTASRRIISLRYFYAAAAATILATTGWWLFFLHPSSFKPIPAPSAITYDDLISEQTDDAMEDALWLYVADTTDCCGLSLSLSLMEEISDERLLELLAESALEEEASTNTAGETAGYEEEPHLEFQDHDSPSFIGVFDFVDMLDTTEAEALNDALHTALEEA